MENNPWRSQRMLVIIHLGSTQAMGQRQKGGDYGIAGKA